jgi:hypothetical protein
MTTTAPPVARKAIAFYGHALPQIEALCDLAREWRDAAPTDEQAIEAHSEFVRLMIRCELRLNRTRVPATASE